MPRRIFICYRRHDSGGSTGRIYDKLQPHFSREQIFIDIHAIPFGEDFVEAIEKAITQCEVVMVVIGRHWLNIQDTSGNRILDDPSDFVRTEIRVALEKNIRIIPVLVDNARMPGGDDLPEDIKSLSRKQAIEVSHLRFAEDTGRLIKRLHEILPKDKPAELTLEERKESGTWKKARKIISIKAQKVQTFVAKLLSDASKAPTFKFLTKENPISDQLMGKRLELDPVPDKKYSLNKTLFPLTSFILVLMVSEIICAVALRIQRGIWIYTQSSNENCRLFETDTTLVGVPKKNVSVTINDILYQHNTEGFRGDEPGRIKSKMRILCIGGSSTYGIGVSNNETWPHYLNLLIWRDGYEVINLGSPGHSTVEHKKLLPEVINRYSPDIVILHCGLNDLHNMNVQDLGNDYSQFHQPSLHASLGFCTQDRLPHIALVHVTFHLLQQAGVVPSCSFRNNAPAGKLSDCVDKRVVNIFSNNLDTMIHECSKKNIPVYLVPQVLSPDAVTEENLKWWIPYLTKKGIFNALDTMNNVMKGKLRDEYVYFINMDDGDWMNQDFYDASHLSPQGNLKLADVMKEAIQSISY